VQGGEVFLPEQQQHFGCHGHDFAVLFLHVLQGLTCQAGLGLAMCAI
jgi:hypothetical protein